MPTIDLLFGNYWIEVLASDYVRKEADGTCSYNFRLSYDYETAILGTALMKNYYVVHDVDNQKVGFAPHASSPTPKRALVVGKTPWCGYLNYNCHYYGNEFKTFPWNDVVAWYAGIIVLVIIPAAALYYFFFRNQNDLSITWDKVTFMANGVIVLISIPAELLYYFFCRTKKQRYLTIIMMPDNDPTVV